MRPYIFEIMNQLIPQLKDDPRLGDLHSAFGYELVERCQELWDQHRAPESSRGDLPGSMEGLLDLLNRLATPTRSSIERLS